MLAVGNIPRTFSLADLLAQSPLPRLFAIVEGVTNAENNRPVGSHLREAFGSPRFDRRPDLLQSFLAPRCSGIPWGQSSNCRWSNRASLIRPSGNCVPQGFVAVAAHPHHGQKRRRHKQTDFTTDCSPRFWERRPGVFPPTILAACDDAVAIPMAGNVDSLNVGAAAAVFLYEATRRWRKMPNLNRSAGILPARNQT